MKITSIFASLTLLIILTAPPASRAENIPSQLKLSDAIDTALKNNLSLLSEGEKLKASEAGVGEASLGLPAQGEYLRDLRPLRRPRHGVRFEIKSAELSASDFAINSLNNPDPVNDFNFRVQVIQPLFNGGKEYLGLKRAKLSYESAKMTHERARMETVYETVQGYWGVALAGGICQGVGNGGKVHRGASEACAVALRPGDADWLRSPAGEGTHGGSAGDAYQGEKQRGHGEGRAEQDTRAAPGHAF